MGYVPALVIDGHTLADSVSVQSLHLGSGSLWRKPHEILMKGGGAIFHGLGSHPGGSRNTPSQLIRSTLDEIISSLVPSLPSISLAGTLRQTTHALEILIIARCRGKKIHLLIKRTLSLGSNGSCSILQLSIIEYLDETRPDPPLLPRDDPFKKALVWSYPLFLEYRKFYCQCPQIWSWITSSHIYMI